MGSSFDVVEPYERLTSYQRRSQNDKAFSIVTSVLLEQCEGLVALHSSEICKTDYRADCGIAAKRVLSARDYHLWKNSYLDFIVPEEKIPLSIRAHIKQRLGREFKRRGLSNPHCYFKEPTWITNQKASTLTSPE
jgi:hypothetical protein